MPKNILTFQKRKKKKSGHLQKLLLLFGEPAHLGFLPPWPMSTAEPHQVRANLEPPLGNSIHICRLSLVSYGQSNIKQSVTLRARGAAGAGSLSWYCFMDWQGRRPVVGGGVFYSCWLDPAARWWH
jgi:hypothetical protein